MTEHAGKVSIRERFEIKIVESSQEALQVWKKSSLGRAEVGAISTKQKIYLFQKPFDGPGAV